MVSKKTRNGLVVAGLAAAGVYAYTQTQRTGAAESQGGGGGGIVASSPVPANAAAGAIPKTKNEDAKERAEGQVQELAQRINQNLGGAAQVRVVQDSEGNFQTFSFVSKKDASSARSSIREGREVGDVVTVVDEGGAAGVYDTRKKASREATGGYSSVDGTVKFADAPTTKKEEKTYSEALFSPVGGY